jgi:poly(A) polymerase/tRNA nucleotidyltransferase (CCA-adding enzyme)
METLGIGPGPEVGRLLRAVEEAQGAGEIHAREEALALIRRLGGVPVPQAGAGEAPPAP